MTWTLTVVGWMATAHAGNRLEWQTPGTTLLEEVNIAVNAEQTCPAETEVVAGWATSGYNDLSTRLSWGQYSDRLTSEWWSRDSPSAPYPMEYLYGGDSYQVSPLCAQPGHCMKYVSKKVESATRTYLSVSAACPATTYPIAGGYKVVSDIPDVLWRADAMVRVKSAEGHGIFSPGAWRVTAESSVPAKWGLEVQVTCVPYDAFKYVRTQTVDRGEAASGPNSDPYQIAHVYAERISDHPTHFPPYTLSEGDDLLPLSIGVRVVGDYGLTGTGARNLLWTMIEAGPSSLDGVSDQSGDSGSVDWYGWGIRPYGLIQASSLNPTDYESWAPLLELLGTLMYIDPADRAAFEAAVYCDNDPPYGEAPWWAEISVPPTFVSRFREIVWLPYELPIEDPGFGPPPPYANLRDGLPVGVATYTDIEDLQGYVADVGAGLDELGIPWVEVATVEETFGYSDDTVVLLVPREEFAESEWLVVDGEKLRGLNHPTVLLLAEGGEGLGVLGLGGDGW